MVRAPCCDKMGLKKGPWTPEEDQILIAYIQRYGHGNWRALPKQAGLLRCGKSCRLRWTNYLRPDIKRGNFSKEEEETIIKLHEMLGNRWSAIAARLPGRTDNEIKNVWHTHLKKRVKPNPSGSELQASIIKMSETDQGNAITNIGPDQPTIDNNSAYLPVSPQTSSSDLSSATDSSVLTVDMSIKDEITDSSSEDIPKIDESIWSEALRVDNFIVTGQEFPSTIIDSYDLQAGSFSPVNGTPCNSNMDDNMDFWFNLFLKAGELPDLELPEF